MARTEIPPHTGRPRWTPHRAPSSACIGNCPERTRRKMNDTLRRPIRSFVMRAGRMTVGQARALEDLWPRFGLEYSPQPLDLSRVFGRSAPMTLEIGFGNGEHLASLAAANPERDYLGIEVHRPGVGHLLMLAGMRELANL